jgi:hypothetical protein
MDDQKQAELRKKILEIQQNTQLSAQEKGRLLQVILSPLNKQQLFSNRGKPEAPKQEVQEEKLDLSITFFVKNIFVKNY